MDEWSLVILTLLVLILPSFRRVFFRKAEIKEPAHVSERLIFFDVLRGLAILAVIFIHVSFFFTHTEGLHNNTFFINLMNNSARFAIAFFFICSGILLNHVKGKIELKDFYLRKIVRIVLPYFLVTMWLFWFKGTSIKEVLYQLVTGTASVPFYFVLVLIQFYLLYPLLLKWRHKKLFLPLSFFISLVYFVSPLPEQPFGFPIFLPFLFFFCYGMYYRDRFLDYHAEKPEIFVWLMIILADFLIMIWGQDYYYNQRYFYGPAMFNLMFYYKDRIMGWKFGKKILLAFGKNSLWIFLTHFSVMWLMYPYLYFLGLNYYLSFFIFYFMSVVSSYLVALLCQLVYAWAIKKLTITNRKVDYGL